MDDLGTLLSWYTQTYLPIFSGKDCNEMSFTERHVKFCSSGKLSGNLKQTKTVVNWKNKMYIQCILNITLMILSICWLDNLLKIASHIAHLPCLLYVRHVWGKTPPQVQGTTNTRWGAIQKRLPRKNMRALRIKRGGGGGDVWLMGALWKKMIITAAKSEDFTDQQHMKRAFSPHKHNETKHVAAAQYVFHTVYNIQAKLWITQKWSANGQMLLSC